MEQTASMKLPNVHIHQFLSRMDLAYAAADLVISRAGAGTISELCLVKKPTILVPSPNVAEDHQTRNALALAERNAAVLISDHEATDRLIKEALQLIEQPEDLQQLSQNIAELAKPNAAKDIAQIVIDSSKRK
jgi:UDP-N-acetylglucosamine--N-acetylmuramyl-(pentapeptide) pyrophosphoryl-undecaprenol N-acetylglucosamine transferase